MNLHVSALDPLSASPRPSKIDFLPSSSASAGMSASLRFTTNSAVCAVKFLTCGKLFSTGTWACADWAPPNFDPAPRNPKEAPAPAAFLKNARLFIPLLLHICRSLGFVLEYVPDFQNRLHALQFCDVRQ